MPFLEMLKLNRPMRKFNSILILLLFSSLITACSTYDERRLTGAWTIKKTINLPQNSKPYKGALISFNRDKSTTYPKISFKDSGDGTWSISNDYHNDIILTVNAANDSFNGNYKLTFKPQNNSHKPPYVFLEATNPNKPSYELVRFEVDLNDYVY